MRLSHLLEEVTSVLANVRTSVAGPSRGKRRVLVMDDSLLRYRRVLAEVMQVKGSRCKRSLLCVSGQRSALAVSQAHLPKNLY